MSKRFHYVILLCSCICLFACGSTMATTQLDDTSTKVFLTWEDESKDMFQTEQTLHLKIAKQEFEAHTILASKLTGDHEEAVDVTWSDEGPFYVATQCFQDGEKLGMKLDFMLEDVVVVSTTSTLIGIDSQSPQIQIFQNDNSEDTWQSFVQEPVSFRFVITEAHFDETKTQIFRRDKGKEDVLLAIEWKQQEATIQLDDVMDTCFVVRSEDSYGNVSEKISKPSSIDVVPPRIQVFEHDKLFTNAGTFYQPMKLRIRVQEEHFDKEKTTLLVNNEATHIVWQELGSNQYEGSIALTSSGPYTISLMTWDVAQNQSEWSESFLLDVDAPQIQLYVNDKEVTSIEMQALYKEDVRIKVVVSDANFDTINSLILLNQESIQGEWKQVGTSYIQEMIVQEEQAYALKVIAKDAGKQESQVSFPLFSIDKTKPVVSVSPPNKTYINEDVEYQIRVKEAHFDGNLIQVSYTYNGIVTQPKVVWEASELGYTTTLRFQQDGLYRVQVVAKDQAGNEGVYQLDQQGLHTVLPDHFFVIDQSAGEMKTMFTQQNDLQIYKQEQQMSIRVQEENFDQQDVLVEIQKDGEVYPVNPRWVHVGDIHSFQLSFAEDGNYHINIKGQDRAGNSFKQSEEEFTFTIDQSAPRLRLEGMPKQQYTNQDVSLQLYMEDLNFAYGECYVLKDGTLYLRTPHFIYQGGMSSLVFPREENGSYEVYIKAVDKAGNESISERESFVIDNQPPQVLATMNQLQIPDKQAFISNQSSDLQIVWSDRNMDTATITLHKNGVEESWNIQDETSFHQRFIAEAGIEDTYKCSIVIRDKAQNVYQQQFSLRVDTYLPPIQIANDIFQGKAKNTKWTAQLLGEKEAFQVLESSLYRNHKQVLNYQWGDEISKDGMYNLSLLIRDEAMNEARLLPSFAFVIDTQSPTIHIVDHQRLQEIDQQILPQGSIRIYDEEGPSAYGIYEITVNDEPISLAKSELDEFGNRFYLLDMSSEGSYTIGVSAQDEAENKTVREVSFQIKADAPPLVNERTTQTPTAFIAPAPTTSSSLLLISCISVVGAIVSAAMFYRYYGRKS